MTRPDFPKNIYEFQARFSSEEECLKFMIESRWPDGFTCPRCGYNEYFWKAARKLLQCKQCGYQTSVMAGTVMHRSKMPLRAWFNAAYLVTTMTPGMSALQFQRQAGIGSYKTAFMMLHKLRSGLVREGRDRLSGLAEVDETYIGGEEPGKTGRGAGGKVIVAGAVDIRGKSANRIRLRVIPNVAGATLTNFVKENIEEGATVRTDDWGGYNKLAQAGYRHDIDLDLVHVHRVFSNLKTWLLGTHHGAVRKQHLQAYLNEYIFRFNRRGTPMAAFQTALGLGSQRLGPTYEGIYGIAKGSPLAWAHPNPKGVKNGS